MNAATHPVAPEEVMAFVDGELSAAHAQSVSAHINECAGCRETRDTIQQTRQTVAKWPVPDVPALLDDRVCRALQELPTDVFLGSLRRLLGRRPVLLWGGTVFAALLILFGLNRAPYDMATYRSRTPVIVAGPQESEYGGSLGKLEQQAPLASPATDRGSGGDAILPLPDQGRNAIPLPLEEPMIARTASLSIVVKDFDAGRASLDAILARHDGYAASLNVSTHHNAARGLEASLRIPARQLEAALGELKTLGRVEGERQNGEEVTQQHADLVARIKNDRETELRLQDILRTRTGKVKDVLDVEQEIARVRGEIEQMEAEQKTLEHRVGFATIDLKLAEEYKAQLNEPAPSVFMQLRNATINGFRNAFGSLLALVLFVAESLPSLLLWLGLLGIPAGCLWRRYHRAQSLGSLAGA